MKKNEFDYNINDKYTVWKQSVIAFSSAVSFRPLVLLKAAKLRSQASALSGSSSCRSIVVRDAIVVPHAREQPPVAAARLFAKPTVQAAASQTCERHSTWCDQTRKEEVK